MKITSVKAIPFRARRKNVWHAAFGQVAESEYAIVMIGTDEGVRGVGEIATVWHRRGASQADDVNRLIAPLLIGKSPLSLNELCITVHRALGRDSNQRPVWTLRSTTLSAAFLMSRSTSFWVVSCATA